MFSTPLSTRRCKAAIINSERPKGMQRMTIANAIPSILPSHGVNLPMSPVADLEFSHLVRHFGMMIMGEIAKNEVISLSKAQPRWAHYLKFQCYYKSLLANATDTTARK